MSEKVYKKIRVVGCAEGSIERAVELAVEKASASLHGVSWFEIVEVRGAVREGKPSEYQVTLELGFKID